MNVQGANFDQAHIQATLNKRRHNGLLALEAGLKEWDLARFIFKVDEVERFDNCGEEEQ